MAGPAFDAWSYGGLNTGTISWTHTPVGTPKGIYVPIAQDDGDSTDQVTGVTYGGVAMTRHAAATVFASAGSEDGACYLYKLESSIPGGAQNVVVSVNGTASNKAAGCLSVTASGTVEVDTATTLDSAGVANPSVNLGTSTDTFVFGLLLSGQNAPSGIASGADYTNLQEEDFGSQTASWQRRTTNPSAGTIGVDWVATSEEAAIIAVAIKDSGAATFSATAALTLGGIEVAATAESDPPTFAATAALLLGGIEVAATVEGPLYAATAALTLGGIEVAASAHTIFFNAAAVLGLGGIQVSAVATSLASFEATADLVLGGIRVTAAAHGSIYFATAALTLGGIETASTATFTPADFNATAALVLGGIEVAATATFESPDFTATAALVLGGIEIAAAATFSCGTGPASSALVQHKRNTGTVTHRRCTARVVSKPKTC